MGISEARYRPIFCFLLWTLALHYLEDWNLTIREFHRVLKASGQLIISKSSNLLNAACTYPKSQYLFTT